MKKILRSRGCPQTVVRPIFGNGHPYTLYHKVSQNTPANQARKKARRRRTDPPVSVARALRMELTKQERAALQTLARLRHTSAQRPPYLPLGFASLSCLARPASISSNFPTLFAI